MASKNSMIGRLLAQPTRISRNFRDVIKSGASVASTQGFRLFDFTGDGKQDSKYVVRFEDEDGDGEHDDSVPWVDEDTGDLVD